MARWLVVLAACGLSLAAVGVAQECPEIVATLPLGYPDVVATDVMVEGTLAVVATHDVPADPDRVGLLDLSDPLAPQLLGQVQLDPPATEIALSGNHLYVVQELLLQVFDLTDPSLPVEVGSLPLPYPPRDLAVAGPLLHVVDQDGLRVVDVSTPASPQIVGLLEGNYYRVAAAGDYVYPGYGMYLWGCLGGELDVVDVSSPTSPTLVGAIGTSAPHMTSASGDRLVVMGEGGCVGQWWPYVDVYDLTTPSTPQSVFTNVLLNGLAEEAEQHGQLLFVSGQADSRVRAYDISLPYFTETAWVELPDPHGLATLGRFLLVADSELGLVVLDTTCVGGMFADGFESGGTGAWSEAWP
jgi:hypothetical protein